MLKNFLILALRNVQRQPGYTFLNILGLTIGISATLFILLYLQRELSYDTYHEKSDRIFRVSSDITEPDNSFRWAVSQLPLGPALKQDYPVVEEYVRFVGAGRTAFEQEQRSFFVDDVYLVDSTVFNVFSFNLIQGDPLTALDGPNKIMIKESLAKRMFGNQNPLGQRLTTASDRSYEVSGVYQDMPANSHLLADALISMSTEPGLRNSNSWGAFSIYTYVLLPKASDAALLNTHLPEVIEKYVATIFGQFGIKIRYELIPLTRIHLYSTFESEPEPTGNPEYLMIFGAIGLFMLLIASINYMNLATARSVRRAREVGLRKVMGSHRRQLILQFLFESFLFSLVSVCLSLAVVALLLPFFNQVFNLTLQIQTIFSPTLLLSLLGIMLLLAFLSGSYPAFFLSAFKPVQVLKGKLATGSGRNPLRKTLVVVQFVISLFMLVGTGVIYDQLRYVRDKDLGFDKEQVMTIEFTDQQQQEKWPILWKSLTQQAGVISAGTASSSPGEGYSKNLMNIETAEGTMDQRGIDLIAVDFDHFPTLQTTLSAGRYFSRDFPTDSTQAVMVNEAMVKRMAWTDPLGKKIQLQPNDTLPFLRVVGVVKDFHQQSLYNEIEPLLFIPQFNNRVAHIRLAGNNIENSIQQVQRSFEAVFPNTPFEYGFVAENFWEEYQEDQRRGKIFLLFSGISIFIACLGLLGLASFTAEQRTKEISVRKVLGAENHDILYLLTRDFLKLVGIAALPAFGIAWYFMRKWLNSFVYHTDFNLLLFVQALVLTLFITLLATGFHAWRASRLNPAQALKYE